jgi:FAD/FMN-containing dehydrogenase
VVVGVDAPDTEKVDVRDWIARSYGSVHPWGSGRVFPNFPDPELDDWSFAYHGTNYERLLEVKARYDPDDVFRFHQSLPATASH